MQQPDLRKSYTALHTAIFLFGFTGILGRLISLQAGALVWHRLWMTALMMYFVTRFSGTFRMPQRKELFPIALLAFTITIHWLLFYGAIKLAGVSVAMICLSAIAFFTAILEPLILKQAFSKIQLFFSILVIGGIWFMAGAQEGGLTGVLVGLASAFFSALFTVLNKKIVHRYDARLLTFYELSAGFILLSLLLPFMQIFWPQGPIMPSGNDWLYLFLLSSFCTVLAFSLWVKSLKGLSPFTVNLAINLEPVYGIALAFLLFREYEMLGPGFYAGSALILLSVAGEVVWKYYRQRRQVYKTTQTTSI